MPTLSERIDELKTICSTLNFTYEVQVTETWSSSRTDASTNETVTIWASGKSYHFKGADGLEKCLIDLRKL